MKKHYNRNIGFGTFLRKENQIRQSRKLYDHICNNNYKNVLHNVNQTLKKGTKKILYNNNNKNGMLIAWMD